MENWRSLLISPQTPVLKAVEHMDSNPVKILLVVDEHEYLLGTVTDGDIRRGILKGVRPDSRVNTIMNPNPRTVKEHEPLDKVLALMKEKQLHHMPIVNDKGHVLGIKLLDELSRRSSYDNWVILMVGGFGTRLMPLTEECPKPLLKVGAKPILETILENFIEYGFKNFLFCVNYKMQMVKEYFADGRRWGAQICYIHEKERLGTAGALGLLPKRPDKPVIVMNGDLLTKVNFRMLLQFHNEHEACATMGVREYDFQVPFGVVGLDRHKIVNIDEKPIQKFFVNAGIYVLEPEVLDHIPENTYLDMPDLFNQLIKQQKEVTAFPIREYWLDIGRVDDLERANIEFSKVFT